MFDFLGDLLGLNKGKATKIAANQNTGLIRQYDDRGSNIIQGGANEAGDYLSQVSGLYDPLKGATGLYADANGLNGAEGNTRATSAFQTGPGYEFQREQGLNALDRRASAAGRVQSGNADIDAMTYATGLADQSYGSWLDRLGGMSSTALSGQTGALNNLANLATGTASQKLGLAGDVTSGLLGANNQYAQGEEANKAGIASLGSNLIGMAGKAFGWGGF
jgi:hypothetical protein